MRIANRVAVARPAAQATRPAVTVIMAVAMRKTRARAIAVAVVLLVIIAATTIGCQRRSSPRAQQFTDFSLGTVITISFYDGGGRARNAQVAERLFSYARDLEERMSTSQADYTESELLLGNQNAGLRPTTISTDTVAVLTEGVRLSQLTDGAFQIGIWPLTRLWDFSTLLDAEGDEAAALLPSAAEIAVALPLVTHEGIRLDNAHSTVSFSEAGMGVDVGGIAKGWVGMWFRDELKRDGVQRALIDIGGNIVTVGAGPTEQREWRIGIQDPTAPQGEVVGVLVVGEGAVVTSGNYEQSIVVDGVRYHHIIDPTTGKPVANQLNSVTIVTADSTDADALSTAVYVKGLARGREFVDQQEDVEALFITKDNVIVLTDGLRSSFTLQSDAFVISQ